MVKNLENPDPVCAKRPHLTLLIDSFRFMSSSLSNLLDNLSEGLYSDKCTNCSSCLDYMTTKDEQLFLGALGVKRIMKKTLIKN